MEASFNKLPNISTTNNISTENNKNSENKIREFTFKKTEENIFMLNDKTSKINLYFNLKNKQMPSINVENIPSLNKLSLTFDKKQNEMVLITDNKILNLQEHSISDKTNINADELIKHLELYKNSVIIPNIILIHSIKNLEKSAIERMYLNNTEYSKKTNHIHTQSNIKSQLTSKVQSQNIQTKR